MCELFESICKNADEAKHDIATLHQLWVILKTNKSRMTEAQFDFAREHIGGYFETCEAKIEVEEFMKKNADE